jgi:diguanylate cyclase (GGDEF)-like protein
LRGFFGKSIARKVAFTVGGATAAVTLVGLGGMLLLYFSDVEAHGHTALDRQAEALAAAFAVIDRDSGRHPFPALIAEQSGLDLLQKVRLLDREGRIVWSKNESEVGQPLPAPLHGRFLDGRTPFLAERERDGLSVIRQVRARQSCLACHGARGVRAAGDLVGGVHLEGSPTHLTGRLSAYAYLQIATALLLVAFVGVWTGLTLRWFLNAPLLRLHRSMAQAESGQGLNRAEVSGEDELGQLAEDFNRLLAKLTDAQATQIDQEMALVITRKDLDHKTELEAKNLIIEEQNRELTRRLDDLGLLFEVTRTLTSSLELEKVLASFHEAIVKKVSFHKFSLLLWDERRQKLEIRHVFGPQTAEASVGSLVAAEGLMAEAVRRGQHVLEPDLRALTRQGPIERALPAEGSFLCVPVRAKQRLLGLLNFTRTRPEAFSPEEIILLQAIAHQAALAILNARLYQEKLEMSVTDELTRLANRRELQTRLSMEWDRTKRFSQPLAILMVDIDHFKRYNDVNGHLLGDQALSGVARLLEKNTRKVDTVARFGGEEFVVILPGQDKPTALGVAEKLRQAVAEGDFPRMATQPEGRLTITVGVSAHPDDGDDPTQLLDRADLALYVAKRAGRNQVAPFEPGMLQSAAQRAEEKQHKKPRVKRRRSGEPEAS